MSVFDLLCKTSIEEAMEVVYKEGKSKPYCPIRFFSKEELDKIRSEKENEKDC